MNEPKPDPMTLVVVSDLLKSRELNSITLSLWVNCGDVRMFEGKSDHCSRLYITHCLSTKPYSCLLGISSNH